MHIGLMYAALVAAGEISKDGRRVAKPEEPKAWPGDAEIPTAAPVAEIAPPCPVSEVEIADPLGSDVARSSC